MRILVADDNHDSADAFALLLQLTGHEVRTAYSGSDALAAAGKFHPDLALLDIGMPGMTGYEVARGIRAAEWGRNMVLVAVTGWGQDDDKQRAEDAGFDHHLTKPLDISVLEPLLARYGREA